VSGKPVQFALVDGEATLRIALPGGYELELVAGKPHATDDPVEINALDAHPAAERVEPDAKAAKTAPAPAPAEEASA
jgi:hypothetical protein